MFMEMVVPLAWVPEWGDAEQGPAVNMEHKQGKNFPHSKPLGFGGCHIA